jgi:hypothetical protein
VNRPDRLAPGLGGGGDVVASEVRVNPFPEGTFDIVTGQKAGGGGDVVASDFRVKRFFLNKNLGLRCRPGGLRRRLPKEAGLSSQPGFSAISQTLKA